MIQLAPEELAAFVIDQRWFGAKSRSISEIVFTEVIAVRESDPRLDLAIVEVRFGPGTHALYQLPIGERPIGQEPEEDASVIVGREDRVLYDATVDRELVAELIAMMRDDHCIDTANGNAAFHHLEGFDATAAEVRPLAVEQSNSSLVVDERYVLKVFRRLGAGVNPELEMLRFLTERGFDHIAPLRAWYEHTGGQLDATLGIVQDYARDSRDGWAIALEDLRSDDPFRFVARAEELGEVTGALHAVLATETEDEAFAPEETSMEALGLLTATVDEEIEVVFRDLPDGVADLEPVRGRGQEIRDRLGLLTQVGSVGRTIRHHGDYHLGQVLDSEGRWLILDFEGEPARPLAERRGKRSPLRDVAGMLRSFAYAASAARILHDTPAPAHWEDAVREAFLTGYGRTVDPTLLPPGEAAVQRLLAVFELEKVVYELRYELDHRPEWVGIPVAGIVRLLEHEPEGATR